MTPGDISSLPSAERSPAGQTPMRTEGLCASTNGGSNAHRVRDIDVVAVNICLPEPVDGFARGRFVERILQRADVHLRAVEVRQMQDGGTGLAQNVFGLASIAHPRRSAAARMAFIHFGPHLWIVGPRPGGSEASPGK